MGRTYEFQCPQCQYRAKVSGGMDSGLHCEVQTVVCRDCRELFDVCTRRRETADGPRKIKFPAYFRPEIPPVLLRNGTGKQPWVWRQYPLACPAAPRHFVEPWRDPGRCPRCGNFMEKNGLPFRLWD